MRQFGSSVGISMSETLLTRNTQIVHATLVEHLSPFGPILHAQWAFGSPTAHALAQLNETVTQQATMIAYIDIFKLMMIPRMAGIPLIFLLRNGTARPERVAVD
jgi:MFS transporter, DHA2 family, multidrug resistance protein